MTDATSSQSRVIFVFSSLSAVVVWPQYVSLSLCERHFHMNDYNLFRLACTCVRDFMKCKIRRQNPYLSMLN